MIHVVSLEAKKALSYRVDFWLSFGGNLAGQMFIAYFLWKAIYDARGVEVLGGYSFHGMMAYSLLVPLVNQIVRLQEMNFISPEIYDGSLTRYLLYPLSYLQYKYAETLAHAAVSALRLLVTLGIFALLFGLPSETPITPASLAMGLAAAAFAGLTYYCMAASLEMMAFWADNVWSLLVILRFATNFLGGGLVPLTLFPDWGRSVLELLPFAYYVSFPIRTLLGQVAAREWAIGMAVLAGWCAFFAALAAWVWRRGTRQYAGVGI